MEPTNEQIAADFEQIDKLQRDAEQAAIDAKRAVELSSELHDRLALAKETTQVHAGVPLAVEIKIGKGPAWEYGDARTRGTVTVAGGHYNSHLVGGREAEINQSGGYANKRMVDVTLCWWAHDLDDAMREKLAAAGHRHNSLDTRVTSWRLGIECVSIETAIEAAAEWVARGIIPDQANYPQIPANRRTKVLPKDKRPQRTSKAWCGW